MATDEGGKLIIVPYERRQPKAAAYTAFTADCRPHSLGRSIMAHLIDVDPGNIQPFKAIHRVLIVKGELQLDPDDQKSSRPRSRLVLLLVGSATVTTEKDNLKTKFVLESRYEAIEIDPHEVVRIETQSIDGALLIIEADE